MEAVFFSAFGKAMLSLTDGDYYKRQQKFTVLNKSISVINDYYEVTDEDKEAVLTKISDAIIKMFHVTYVYNTQAGEGIGGSVAEKHPHQYEKCICYRIEANCRKA